MKIKRFRRDKILKNNNEVLLEKYKNIGPQRDWHKQECSKWPIFSNPQMKTTKMSINRRIDNQIISIVHAYNGIQFSSKKE